MHTTHVQCSRIVLIVPNALKTIKNDSIGYIYSLGETCAADNEDEERTGLDKHPQSLETLDSTNQAGTDGTDVDSDLWGGAMKAILKLERLGYRFTFDGGAWQCSHRGVSPRPEIVRPLFEELRQQREAVISFLRTRKSQEARSQVNLEAAASALLDRMDRMDKREWCRQWAEVMTRLNAPCTGYPSWADWLAEVEADL
jgi:hypothetical protein